MNINSDVGAKRLGLILRTIREERGMSLRQFADLCGKEGKKSALGYSTLAKIERGEIPSHTTLRAISHNPYVAASYTLADLLNILSGANPKLSNRAATTAHDLIPLAEGLDEIQRYELVVYIVKSLKLDFQKKLLTDVVDIIKK